MSDNSGSSSDSSAIIGGAVGGVILLMMIIIVLCIVILCMRRSHRKKGLHVAKNTIIFNTDVTMDDNPSYDVTKVDTLYHSYDTINPGDSNVPITTNPSYNVHTKPYSKTSEDDYNYVQPKLIPDQHSEGTSKMDTNPSYGVNVKENRAKNFNNVILDTKAHQSSHDATNKQYDYAYVHDDHLLHYSKPSNATDDDENETLYK